MGAAAVVQRLRMGQLEGSSETIAQQRGSSFPYHVTGLHARWAESSKMRRMREELGGLVTAVDHVGIAVPDLDEAIEFHRSTFGLELAHRELNEEQQVHEAMLRAPGDTSGAAQVQLLAPADEVSTVAKFLERSGPGLQQLAYRVTDVTEAARVLRDKGLRMLYDEPRRGTADSRVNFVHPKDAGGVLVELVQPAE